MDIYKQTNAGSSETPVVALVAPLSPLKSETFIKMHMERLPGRICCYTGSTPEKIIAADPSILSMRGSTRMCRLLNRLIRRTSMKAQLTSALVRRWKQEGVQLVLAEFGPVGADIWTACRKANLPLMVHFHGVDAYGDQYVCRLAETYRDMFNYAETVVAVSNHMAEQLRSLGAPASKVFVNPYGVDIQYFHTCRPDLNPQTFLAVGRFVPKKAPHLTLLAFSMVLNDYPRATLIMVGDGPLLPLCRQIVTGLNMEKSVTFKGVLSQAEIGSLMRGARAFVQHSVRAHDGDCEGTPLAVLEAGASGLPVIATRHTGIADAVQDGLTGWLVDEGDVEGMARSMCRALAHPEDVAKLGQAARARIETHYESRQQLGKLWARMLDVMRSSPSASVRQSR